MKSYLFLILIVVAMFFVVTKSEDEDYYTTEQPENEDEIITTTENALLRTGPEEYGKREQLDPNLTGLENFAILYLPKNYNYSNVIDAYREVKDGIRYEILANATDQRNISIFCNLTIYEKSWFVTPWGERLRILEKSNCSTQAEIKDINENFSIDQASIDQAYENNTIFNPENKKLSSGTSLDDIESMMIETKDKKEKQNMVQSTNVNNQNYETTIQSIMETTLLQTDVNTVTADLSVRNDNVDNEEIKGNLNNSNQISDREQQNQKHEHVNNRHYLRNKRSPKKYNLKKSEHLFEKFQKKFDRNYENAFEKQKRYQIFKSNLLKINQLNKKEQGTAKYGLTEFADMTTTEYKMRTGLLYDPDNNEIGNPIADVPNTDLPKEFDWRTKNVITKVKDQGQCGSCWAFSTVANIEGLHAIKTGQLQEYSEQELLDCDTIDKACQGGLMDDAYKALEQLGGLELESEYPYEAHKDKCKLNKTKIHVKIKGGIDLPKNETAMALWLVNNGPISIGLNANAMMFYKAGISHPWSLLCRAGGIDHGVLIVGFGVAEFPVYNKTLPYWIIKNSWGETWGEQGYYRLYRGANICGVREMASSATLE